MSFAAEISVDKHKLIWSKSILALSLISEEIKFVIGSHGLTVSALNSTATNNGEIQFDHSFFQDYKVDFSQTIKEGYDEEDQSYSFVVNSHHVSILFKNFDANSLIHFKVKFNDSFKLHIEIKRNLVVKKYQINYHPIKNIQDSTVEEYKAKYNSQSPSQVEVKYIKMDQSILKNFIDMIPLQTEEFRIEVRNNKIMFNGFTQEVLKDNQYLKQPMSITISLNLEELISNNLSADLDQFINFKLKFLKIFINLINLVRLNQFDNLNDYCEMYFRNPGDPIVFELNNNPHVKITFIQLTNDEGTATTSSVSSKPVLKSYQLEQITETNSSRSSDIGSRGSRSTLGSRSTPGARSTLGSTSTLGSKDPVSKVTLHPPTTRGDNSPEIDQLDINFDSDQESEFGPTQMDEVKSIFD